MNRMSTDYELNPTADEVVGVLQQQHPDIFKALYFEIRSAKLEQKLNEVAGNFSMPMKEGESDEGSTE